MKTEKKNQKRIIARVMAQEISAEQLKRATGGEEFPPHLGSCTNHIDCDSADY